MLVKGGTGDKPLSEPMLCYCQLDPKNSNQILFEIQKCQFMKMHLKMSSAEWRTFCLGLNVIKHSPRCAPHLDIQ